MANAEAHVSRLKNEIKKLEDRDKKISIYLYRHRVAAFLRNFDADNSLNVTKDSLEEELKTIDSFISSDFKNDFVPKVFAEVNTGVFNDIQFNQIITYQLALSFFKNRCGACTSEK